MKAEGADHEGVTEGHKNGRGGEGEGGWGRAGRWGSFTSGFPLACQEVALYGSSKGLAWL